MALKNIHDSMTQPGFKSRGTHEKRYQKRIIRKQTRRILHQLDPDVIEDLLLPTNPPTRREETVNMTLAHKWLEKQVGKPWKQVEKQLERQFGNDCSVRGIWIRRNIRKWICLSESLYARTHNDFYVDDDGLLQDSMTLYRKISWCSPREWVSDQCLKAWARERKIACHHGIPCWYEPVEWQERSMRWKDGNVYVYTVVVSYRKAQPLTEEERSFYECLSGMRLNEVKLRVARRFWQRPQIIEE